MIMKSLQGKKRVLEHCKIIESGRKMLKKFMMKMKDEGDCVE